MDRQKYVAELGKLLSGMAAADREAVLRGINRRFDEEDNDAAVIASLGSPTFAAVSVLRGYVPPEEGDEPLGPEPAAAPEAEPEAEPAEPETEPEPEPEPELEEEAAPEEPEPGPEVSPAPVELEAEADEAEPAEAADIQAEAGPEDETEPEAEAESEAEAEPAAEAEPVDEAVQEAENGAAPEPAPEEEASGEDLPAVEAEAEAQEEEPAELPPFWGGPPELPKPPKAKVGLLIVYIFCSLIIGIPVTVLLTVLALAILCAGALVIGSAALLVSFCFLGMGVVADILLLAGAGLVFAALGLLLICTAVWCFRRCVIGFIDLIIKKGRDWCYERGKEELA